MSRPLTTRQCQPGQTCWAPDPRRARRPRHGAQPACRPARQAARHPRWFQTPGNREACTGPPTASVSSSGAEPPRAPGDARALGLPRRSTRPWPRQSSHHHHGLRA